MNGVVSFPSQHAQELARWRENYKRLFGEAPQLHNIQVPERPNHIVPRLIVVPQELILWTAGNLHEDLVRVVAKHFRCRHGFDEGLEEAVKGSDRSPHNGSYAVWVRGDLEADLQYANRSAVVLRKGKHKGITVLERLLLEVDHFFEHGLHLDQESVTICTGTHCELDGIVCADWSGDRLFFFRSSIRSASERRRSREVWC